MDFIGVYLQVTRIHARQGKGKGNHWPCAEEQAADHTKVYTMQRKKTAKSISFEKPDSSGQGYHTVAAPALKDHSQSLPARLHGPSEKDGSLQAPVSL